MKPRCLLIAPAKYFYKKQTGEQVKYHLLTLLSHLADIADVQILDLEDRFGSPQTEAEIVVWCAQASQALAAYRPDVVGISAYTSYDYLCSVDLLRLCHTQFPGAIKVVGGYHPTAVPRDYLAASVPVDYIVRGEGEVALRTLVTRGRLEGGPVVTGSPLDLRNEAPLRYDLYGRQTDEMTLSLSRGCPYSCSFCVQSDDVPNAYRALDTDAIREKLQRMRRHLPVKRVMFLDPFFGADRRHTAELLRLLADGFSDISFWAETRIDAVHDEWLDLVRPLKLDLHFGVESLHVDTLRLMEKTRRPESYIDSFHRTLDACQQRGLLARCGFIMNYPGEDADSCPATLAQVRAAVERWEEVNFVFHCNQYALYPGNRIYDRREELAHDRGFAYENDGWWRVRTPMMHLRSQQCTASRAVAARHGPNPRFWLSQALETGMLNGARMSYRAYSFYANDQIVNALRDSYPTEHVGVWDDSVLADQKDLVRLLRYRLRQVFDRHTRRIDKRTDVLEALERLFDHLARQRQGSLLRAYDRGVPLAELKESVEQMYRGLCAECEQQEGQVDGTGVVGFTLGGEPYRLGAAGAVWKAANIATGSA